MYRSLFFIVGSMSIGFILYMIFYYMQMHAFVDFENGVLDAPHILLILGIVGLVLSLF